jgi:hypothetical protein
VDASDSYREGIGLELMRGDTEGSQYLADATGGTWFGNTRNLAQGFANIDSSLESYYSLGYTRPQPPDGKIHTVQVTVRGKGLRIRHHNRTWDRTGEQRLLDLVYSRLMLDQGSNPLEVRLEVGPARAIADGMAAREVEIFLPTEHVMLISGEDGPAVNAVVAFQSSDARGVATEPALLKVQLRPGTDSANRPMAVGAAEIRFGTGPLRLAVGVLDEISGIRSTTAVDLADR